ncbi:MAG: c-type cytochrome, partial [Saprospiraceae bacterium]|nr:c-type cytochrome [Saprospiraceae bacterium]
GVGRSLFYGKALCSTCHAVGGQGSDFGPDLSNIGEIRSRHDLLEALVYPSASFAREYETYHVKSGSTRYVGIINEQTSSSLAIHTGPGSEVRLSPSEIDAVETGTVSLMPSGLEQQLTPKELSHLITFLEALPYRLDRLIEINAGD